MRTAVITFAFGAALAAGVVCASLTAAPPPRNPVLGVVTSSRAFSIGSVEAKPETGPIIVVDGDEVTSHASTVMFRLTGENRAGLGVVSVARIHAWGEDGAYFYLSKGSIQYDARREPLAICARNRLYVPSIPGSGTVAIGDDKVQVTLTLGTMPRSGSEPCSAKAVPLLLTTGAGATTLAGGAVTVAGGSAAAGAGSAAASAAATATATASAAGIGAAVPAAATVGVVTASTAGVVATSITTSVPSSQSPINPSP